MVGSSGLVVLAGETSWLIGFGAAGVLMLADGGDERVVMPHPPERHPARRRVPACRRRREGARVLAGVPDVPRPSRTPSSVLAFLFF